MAITIPYHLFNFLSMNKIAISTLITLIALTFASVLFTSIQIHHVAIVVLVLALIKFLGVAFYFMDLKHAHVFWKTLLIIFISVFVVIILGLINL